MNVRPRVAHLTSAHPRDDARIHHKMCVTLAAAGYDVVLVVADGRGTESQDGINFVDVGSARGRLDRMANVTRRVFRAAVEIDAEIYHFHDPELLAVGLALKRRGKRVIYDAHEDLGRAVLSKPYIPKTLRGAVASLSDFVERSASRSLDFVVGATPTIRDKFVRWNVASETISNFPMLDELVGNGPNAGARSGVCYVGGLVTARGTVEMVRAIGLCQPETRLTIAGGFAEAGLEGRVSSLEGWRKVDFLGQVSREGVREVLSNAVAGIVTLHATPAYVLAYPVKMFEYMAAGLPVIASDFPLWRGIIEECGCGILVDPQDPEAIAGAIRRLTESPELAKEMGERGREAVVQRYNWSTEAAKLLAIYEHVRSAP